MHEKELLEIGSKNADDYADISLTLLTVYSLYWLQEWGLRCTVEAISVLNSRLFPDKFRLIGFSEFPDTLRTNRSLMQGQPKYRNWLTGSATKGFMLNANGIAQAEALIQRIGVPERGGGKPVSNFQAKLNPKIRGRARTIEPEREIAKVRGSRAFSIWKNDELTEKHLIHIHSLLGTFNHTPLKVRRKKVNDLKRAAGDLADKEVREFLDEITRIFGGRI